MKNQLIINTLLILTITIKVTWYAILWVSYVSTPDLLNESDFRAFYATGEIANEFGPSQIYNLDLNLKFQEGVAGHLIPQDEFLVSYHPPLLLPILAIISRFPYSTAYSLYGLFLISLTLISLLFFYKTLKSKDWSMGTVWLILIASFLFEPLFISILKGQDSALLLLGMVIWFTGLIKDDDRQAGLGLALTAIRPQISLFLAIPFLFRKRKVFGWYCLGASLLVFYSYLLVGKQGFLDYLSLIRLSSEGQDFGLNLSAMFNITGLLLRIFPGVDATILNFLKWGLYGISLAGMVLVWMRSQKIQIRHIVLLVITGLFFSPHLHYHDLSALIIPIFGMVLLWINKGVIQEKMAPLIILILSTIFLIGNIFESLYHILPYLIMILLMVGSWSSDSILYRGKGSSMQAD